MNFLRALKGRRSVSLKGCLILAPGALLATMAVEFVAHGSLGAALVSALLITAVSGLVLWLAAVTVLRNRSTSGCSLIVVSAVYVAVGLARGVTAWLFSCWFASSWEVFPVDRLISAVTVTFADLTVLAILLDWYDRRLAALVELEIRSVKLRHQRVETSRAVQHAQAALVQTLDDILTPSLNTLLGRIEALSERKKITPDMVGAVALDARQCAQSSVRPLAHSIERGATPTATLPQDAVLLADIEPALVRQVGARQAWRNAFLVAPFHPAVVAVATLLISLPSGIRYSSLALGPIGAASCSVVIFVLTVVARWILNSQRRHRMRPWVCVTAVFAAHVLIGLLATCSMSWIGIAVLGRASPLPAALLVGGVIGYLGVSVPVAFIATSAQQYREAQIRVSAVNRLISDEVSLKEADLRHVRAVVARIVHGRIQSGLVSVAVYLDKAAATLAANQGPHASTLGDDGHGALIVARARLEALQSEIRDLEPTIGPADVVADLGKITSLWDGLIAIELDVAADAMCEITVHRAVGQKVLEVCQEAVTNAVKHGRASQISITIALADQPHAVTRAVIVTADDDGQPPTEEVVVGFGLRQSDSGPDTVTLTPSRLGGTRLCASVALPPIDSIDAAEPSLPVLAPF